MNKKIVKILSILLITIMMISLTSSVFALTPGELTGDPDIGGDKIKTVGNSIIGILQTVGVVLSVVVLIILGIKYMMGSAEEKAEYKKTMIPYLVGAVLIFAASALAGVIVEFVQGITAS